MTLGSFEAIVRALDSAGVRYLVAGGLAVNAHGYLRFTRDVDVVVQLSPSNVAAAFAALATIGYRPIAPVAAADLADPDKRAGWIRDKHIDGAELLVGGTQGNADRCFCNRALRFRGRVRARPREGAGFHRRSVRFHSDVDPN